MKSQALNRVLLEERHPYEIRFLRWQCRVRQMAMRENAGRPSDGITPAVFLPGAQEPMGHIVTVLSKRDPYSKTPELIHIAKRTNDPAQRREKALEYFSETYFQKADEFSDVLTASFAPDSDGASAIESAKNCSLVFEAYGQSYQLHCNVKSLPADHWLYQATWWHNYQFNQHLHPQSVILAFSPVWDRCTFEQATVRTDKHSSAGIPAETGNPKSTQNGG